MTLPIAPSGFLVGVDLSRAQGHVMPQALMGIDFAIVKATDGLHDIEPTWRQQSAAVLAAGKVLGAYGVLEPYGATQAAAQAMHFCDIVQDSGAHLVALDFELGKGRPASDLLKSARIWLDTVRERLDRRPLLYTMPAFWNALVQWAGEVSAEDVAAIAAHPLWIADYLSGSHTIDPTKEHPRVPFEWAEAGASIWQVGPHDATLPGGVAVDVNYAKMTRAELCAMCQLTG